MDPSLGQDKAKYAEIVPKTAVSVLKNATADMVEKELENLEPLKRAPSAKHGGTGQSLQTQKSSDSSLIGHDNIIAEQTQHLPEQLENNFKFARICPDCYVQNKVN